MDVKLGVVMDPIRSINTKKDSSFAMLLAAQARGWQLFERVQRFREEGGNMQEFDPGPNPLLLEARLSPTRWTATWTS